MKNNVDLTLNNMFSFETEREYIIFSKLKSLKRHLWDFERLELSSERESDLVITGNKREREKWREIMRAISSQYCDCCGKKINIKPWKFEIRICNECNNDFINKQDKCIWRY